MSSPKQSDAVPPKNRETPISRDIRYLEQLPPRARNEKLSVLEKLAIINGMHSGLTVSLIAKTYKMSASTVKGFKSGMLCDPLSVFNLPVVSRIDTGVYQCRVCGEAKQRLSQAQRHVLSHFFAPEIARNIDLPEVL